MLSRDAYEHLFGLDMPLLKARPVTDGAQRFIYCEPSNETFDSERERVLQRALAGSAEHFLRFGNLDLNHLTLFGWKMDPPLPNPHLYEIGKPVCVIAGGKKFTLERHGDERHVRIDTGSQYRGVPILVQGEIYRGTGLSVENANFFWSSLNDQKPRQDWYPSVAGTKPHRVPVGNGKSEVVAVTWCNIGFAKEPVNKAVSPLTLIAPAEFLKAVLAGYGTDSAGLTGGGALRRQSLDGGDDRAAYRRAAAAYLRQLTPSSKPTAEAIVTFFRDHAGADPMTARSWATRLLRDVTQRVRAADTPARLAA